jgi:hypothetical protein
MPPVAKRKIPISLSIVSYLFFLPSAIYFAFLIFFVSLLIFLGNKNSNGILNGTQIFECFIGGAIAIFYVCLSRGLRRCSRGWRTCALILTWWGFIALTFGVGQYFLTSKTPDHETKMEFVLGYALGFVWQIWQYRVLIRPDIRELFYNES